MKCIVHLYGSNGTIFVVVYSTLVLVIRILSHIPFVVSDLFLVSCVCADNIAF